MRVLEAGVKAGNDSGGNRTGAFVIKREKSIDGILYNRGSQRRGGKIRRKINKVLMTKNKTIDSERKSTDHTILFFISL
ncbi:hypothetical protein AKJ63_00820 [candidate division MSBL1 archaeon SCGC-AAA259D18]|uniref:Uncharacterized protein n=1 Tax=candidate division MSBL1 archaeon SCGC-AAA259D18 TaxID=1698262 RepID=A0A133UC72_9EURY|nr:hypothetical protein AKJ63_00820 [candidate division MSBL1 archaeon SCGC-AAA259D18]